MHCLISIHSFTAGQLGGSYVVGKHKAVLQQPCLLHPCFDRRVVGGTVDLSRSFAQPDEHIFDLRMRVWAVVYRRVFQQFGEEEGVFAYPLYRLRYI